MLLLTYCESGSLGPEPRREKRNQTMTILNDAQTQSSHEHAGPAFSVLRDGMMQIKLESDEAYIDELQ